MPASWPLVGRAFELAAVRDALADPDCGGVALVGSAGVGKTRLAKEAASAAAELGLATVDIRATKSATEIPLGALAPLLTGLDLPPGGGGADLLAAVTEAVAARRGADRLVLVVDDAQDLDDASAALLDALVGRGGTFVVLTMRVGDGGVAAEALVAMWKDERVVRIPVGPLADGQLADLAPLIVGGPLDGVSLTTLVSASAGNVLYLRELIQGSLEAGTLAERRGIWRLEGGLGSSGRLVDLIDHRLRGATEDERTALQLVALGDPLPLSLLGRAVPVEALEALEARGLLESATTGGGSEIRLAHPLYGEVIRSQLSPLRRGRLCRMLADEAEREGTPAERDVLRAAVWRLDGGGDGTRPETFEAAARIAFRSEDFDLAARLARAAWSAGAPVDVALLLADALDLRGQMDEQVALLRQLYPVATTDRDRTGVACRLASALYRHFGQVDEADLVLTDAAGEVADEGCRRQLAAQRGTNFVVSGDVGRALAVDMVLLEHTGDAAAAQAARDAATALSLAGRTEEAISRATEGLTSRLDFEDAADLSHVAVYLVAQSVALLENGRLGEAGALLEAGYLAAVERGNADGQAWFASVLALVRTTEGRLTEAARLFSEGAIVFEQLGHPGRRWGLGGLALATGQLGDPAASTAAVAELDALPPTTMRLMDVWLLRGRGWASVASGDLAEGRRRFWGAVDQAEAWGQLALMAGSLHDLVRVGEPVGDRLEQLADLVDGSLMAGRLAHARAVASGDPDQAADAADRFEACGALLFAAEAATLEAQGASERGLTRRATAARARATALVERCGGARTPALVAETGAEPLSARERDVAELAATGLTSREIAERLYVSVRTVDNHLQRIYTKMGISGRSELAQRLGR